MSHTDPLDGAEVMEATDPAELSDAKRAETCASGTVEGPVDTLTCAKEPTGASQPMETIN